MKKSILVFLASAVLFSACTKKSEAKASVQETNPELQKLSVVLQSMSDRCKAAIPNGDPAEFLRDLKEVLGVCACAIGIPTLTLARKRRS